MYNTKWQNKINFLASGKVGTYLKQNGRKVVVMEACGDRYLLLNTINKKICGVTDDVEEAILFLIQGV